MSETAPARRYRFGTFEADATAGELRRQGIRLRLNAQPFQLLLLLVERQGELLTREEIARELWPDRTFVDFEHGVNSAISRIRDALGDTAANPRFIETLARRGYRFIAPVEKIGSEQVAHSGEVEGKDRRPVAAAESGFPSGILTTLQELPSLPHSRVRTLFVLFQLMYMAFYAGALANLGEIEELLSPLARASWVYIVLIASAGILIPVRAFLICAAIFRAPRFDSKFLKLWPFLLLADVEWSMSPFLLLHHINFGVAISCTALLVYSPFVQRSLVLMGAGRSETSQG